MIGNAIATNPFGLSSSILNEDWSIVGNDTGTEIEVRQATSDLNFSEQIIRVSTMIIECLTKYQDRTDLMNSVINLSNKIKELTVIFDQIKEKPIRLIDTALVIADQSQLIMDEAKKIYDYKTFDTWVNLVFELIKSKLIIFILFINIDIIYLFYCSIIKKDQDALKISHH